MVPYLFNSSDMPALEYNSAGCDRYSVRVGDGTAVKIVQNLGYGTNPP